MQQIPRKSVVEVFWESTPKRVKVSYTKHEIRKSMIQSKTGHEKSCVNERGPSRKAKYYLVTDSEIVP